MTLAQSSPWRSAESHSPRSAPPYRGSAAALSEFGGGTLLALGLLSPLGSIVALAALTMATVKAHWGKPIGVNMGGAELAVTYGTIALAVGLTGPGAYSLDHAFGVRLPRPLVAGATPTAAALVGFGIARRPAATPVTQPEQAAPRRPGRRGASGEREQWSHGEGELMRDTPWGKAHPYDSSLRRRPVIPAADDVAAAHGYARDRGRSAAGVGCER